MWAVDQLARLYAMADRMTPYALATADNICLRQVRYNDKHLRANQQRLYVAAMQERIAQAESDRRVVAQQAQLDDKDQIIRHLRARIKELEHRNDWDD